MTTTRFIHYFVCGCGKQLWAYTGERICCRCGRDHQLDEDHVRRSTTEPRWSFPQHDNWYRFFKLCSLLQLPIYKLPRLMRDRGERASLP